MEPEKTKIGLKILATLPVDDLLLITGKLTAGDIYGSEVILFTCKETGGKWKLGAIGFRTALELQEDIRTIGLEHVEGSKEMNVGYTIVSE